MRKFLGSTGLTVAVIFSPVLSGMVFGTLVASPMATAGVETTINGSVMDSDDVAVGGATIELLSTSGKLVKTVTSGLTGEFDFFPIDFGTYQIVIHAPGMNEYRTTTTVSSGSSARIEARLTKATSTRETVVEVKEKRNLVQVSSAGSKKEISSAQIASMPQGNDISLPKLISSTTPGVVAGPFGQMYIRGNHANIQYQIDGVQLPESTSGTFGDSFSPRNIDHMEVITGGIPAEYGERLSAVMNIVTKAGPETPGGEAEIGYGSYNTITPQATYGGSDASGHVHYFGSLSYSQTDRGLETPQPKSYDDQKHGGSDAVHDKSHGNEEFFRVDDVYDNQNKFTVTGFNSNRYYQIPNYPGSFKVTDPFFQAGYTDKFGNQNDDPTKTTFNYTPPNTNDSQDEQNSYLEFVWKHTFNEHSFLQVAPYVKLSSIKVDNDPVNDLATAAGGATPIAGSQATSFALDRSTNNYGLKIDQTWRATDQHLFKAGMQVQDSASTTKSLSVQTSLNDAAFQDTGNDNGWLETLYAQDSYAPLKSLTINFGLRYSLTQFKSDDISTSDGLLQPRVGLEWLVTESTKLHAFYGKLFQPAPFENLRNAFSTVGGGQLTPYDIKAEKDEYFEGGISQQIGQDNVVGVTYYHKDATNMLDDSQLLNTSIAQPYNFAVGFANGIELSWTGQSSAHVHEFANYSYEDARGKGISGGFFAFDPSGLPPNEYQFLDHVQLNTANAGVTYAKDTCFGTLQGLYGSGLRTGDGNSKSLPAHVTFDVTGGYKFKRTDWADGLRIAVDVLNITDNAYAVTVANGFNGSHYNAGREYFVHLGKDF